MNSAAFSEHETLSNHRLERAGFGELHLADLNIPTIECVEAADGTPLFYSVHGDRNAAETLVFIPMSYSANFEDPSQQVRLAAQQIGLGDEFCVVGVQLYAPNIQEFNHAERALISKGEFSPFANRLLTVIETVATNPDQDVMLYGFSLGGDVSIETAYQNTTNPNKGVRQINRIGAQDCARSKTRNPLWGGIAISKAFEKSGEHLFKNVVLSRSPALLEARGGIDLDDPAAEDRHAKYVKGAVMAYVKADLLGNLAQVRGLATNRSQIQVHELMQNPDAPRQVIGRLEDSLICPPSFIDDLRVFFGDTYNTHIYETEGDHSTVDNVRKSAAFALYAAAA